MQKTVYHSKESCPRKIPTYNNVVSVEKFIDFELKAKADSSFYPRLKLLNIDLCSYCHSMYHSRAFQLRKCNIIGL